jgi:hypothetical protein
VSLYISDHERAALAELAQFPLFASLTGRRSRRFPVGGQIPDGALAYTSRRPVRPLSEVERALLISVAGGVTGWNFGITHTRPPLGAAGECSARRRVSKDAASLSGGRYRDPRFAHAGVARGARR